MTGVTLLGVIFTPILFVLIRTVTGWFRRPSP